MHKAIPQRIGHLMRHRMGRIGLILLAPLLLTTGCGSNYVVLNPAGPVGKTELHLIILSAILVAIVIIPVLLLLWFIIVRYRDRPGNTTKYEPEWQDSKVLEVIWWGIPIIIIAILGFFTTKTTFALTKPPEKNVKPITIDVMSLNWKWLFLYPSKGIATVNYVDIPTGVPVQFVLTADAPMNSFWVPQLGGQEYTMPGMAMGLWLQSDKPGTFQGYGANFAGVGFEHMKFDVVAKSPAQFNAWAAQIKQSNQPLTQVGFNSLTKQDLTKRAAYSSYPPKLFSSVVMKDGGQYMGGMMKAQGLSGNGSTNSTNSTSNSSN